MTTTKNDLVLKLAIIGGGMITNDQILPSVYQLQREGVVSDISMCARHNAPLRELLNSKEFQEAFPGQSFQPYPPLDVPADKYFPDLHKEVIKKLPPRQIVVIAVPDQFHFEMVKEALQHNQHVVCVKPLVLEYRHAVELEKLSQEKGLLVGVEYHKRFDRRSLVAQRQYRAGRYGEFALGEAKLMEPYYYRNSNFQNWFTSDKTDPFVYVGCHYVDLVYFITGLNPVEISVSGVKGKFPNGNEAYMWANARVRYENGALLTVNAGLGYPDLAAGSNDQGLLMYCEGKGKTGMIEHIDDDRGSRYSYLEGIGPGGSHYNYVSPDYFKLVPWEGPGLKPVGYGHDSVAAIINTIRNIEGSVAGLSESESLKKRQELIREVDERGLIATPANSSVNELVMEAARISILSDGEWVKISHGKNAGVQPRNKR